MAVYTIAWWQSTSAAEERLFPRQDRNADKQLHYLKDQKGGLALMLNILYHGDRHYCNTSSAVRIDLSSAYHY
jgi:hypothetical protein